MLYLLFGSITLFVMSTVFFMMHKELLRRDGILPPKIIYRKNYFGLEEKQEIIWQTKPLDGWAKDDKAIATFCLFVLKWGLLIGGWFMFAGFLSLVSGVK